MAATNGPVSITNAFLSKNAERIKAGRISRMDAIRALGEKGVNSATAAGTTVKWMRTNNLEWSKPSRAPAASKKPATKVAR